MRGGARVGAGRPGWKIKAELLPHIDIRTWPVEAAAQSAVLQYEFSGQKICKTINLRRTPCYFGGYRIWFLCPYCARRAAKLYWVNGQWYCRKSLNLAYASQSMNRRDRLHRRLSILEEQLDADGEKPQGMHWKTYNRITHEYRNTEAALLQALQIAQWNKHSGLIT